MSSRSIPPSASLMPAALAGCVLPPIMGQEQVVVIGMLPQLRDLGPLPGLSSIQGDRRPDRPVREIEDEHEFFEVMIPLFGHVEQLKRQKAIVLEEAKRVLGEGSGTPRRSASSTRSVSTTSPARPTGCRSRVWRRRRRSSRSRTRTDTRASVARASVSWRDRSEICSFLAGQGDPDGRSGPSCR